MMTLDRTPAREQWRRSARENEARETEAPPTIDASTRATTRRSRVVSAAQPAPPGPRRTARPWPTPFVEPLAPRRDDSQLGPGEPVIGYVAIGNDIPASGDAREAVRTACRRAGWDLLEIVHDRESTSRPSKRPGLEYALARVSAGDARALVISNAKHLSRSIVELGALMEWFSEAQAVLIALDLGVDTSTSDGQRIAAVLGMLGQWEHERIAQRTRRALRDLKSRGSSIGRPTINDRPDLRERIEAMRLAGMTLQAIADALNAEGIPTVRGGALWRPSSVQTALGYQRPRGGRRQRPLPEPHRLIVPE